MPMLLSQRDCKQVPCGDETPIANALVGTSSNLQLEWIDYSFPCFKILTLLLFVITANNLSVPEQWEIQECGTSSSN